ncbi:MAG: copper amine oxidase N-terminal domain-containing protein [Clostridia bacterium]|nr:copper amine oxidase N-terminal domain-containing protein [Clostridia bacterium]
MAQDVITITVDGAFVDCAAYGQVPVIVEGRTLVPLRSVFEALGATVEWNNEERSVTSVKGDVTITLAVDSKDLVVNGQVKTLDVPAQIMNERTMVPVRAVAEAFGSAVAWDNAARCVVITTVAEKAPEVVVKEAMDAVFALDFEKGASYYKDPSKAMGEFAGATDVAGIVSAVAGEEFTEEQTQMVEKYTKEIMQFITYEVTGSRIDGNTAEVYTKLIMPNMDAMDLEAYFTEEAILYLYTELLDGTGYTIETIAFITDEAEITAVTNYLMEGTLAYVVAAIEEETKVAGYIATEEVEKLEKIDGKWLIVTE